MADTRTLDVWITDRNMVYRGVPYTVVADWVQEGRLLEADRVRTNQNQAWQKLADNALLSPYLPKPELDRAEDQAEALEKIELDIEVKKNEEADDDDVDMIPLIDISMVLLVFFMMTAQALLTATPIDTPGAKNAFVVDSKGTMAISVEIPKEGGGIAYYAGDDYKNAMSEEQILKDLEAQVKLLAAANKPTPRIILNGAKTVPYETIQQLTIKLQKLGCKMQAKVKGTGGGGEAAP